MYMQDKKKHMIDFLFPVVLFFVFTLSALTVILLAAGIYQSTTEESSLNDSARTSLSYISEKLHQSDAADSVSIGTFDGCEALILKHSSDDDDYYTYIYAYNNELKELFVSGDAAVSADDGRTILQIKTFDIELLSDNLLQLKCTDMQQQEASVVVGVRGAVTQQLR